MDAVERIRAATANTPLEGRLYIVGGAIRDRLMGRDERSDLDIVVDGDAVAVATLLADAGLSEHRPVVYERFGTARLQIGEAVVELSSARAESYDRRSRKPHVRPGSLLEDVLRRDFTVNTLVESLHTGEIHDLSGRARSDIRARLIRTPLDPATTFDDDPLRMLRAVRFAVTLNFEIAPETWEGMVAQAFRLDLLGPGPPVVSAERIRDEFVKIIMSGDPSRGLSLLREAGLLERFLPELCAMVNVTQNDWHTRDVWDHTLFALTQLDEKAPLDLRLGVLFHDVGKPVTRTVDERGVHFYSHETAGAEITRVALHRLRMPGALVKNVVALVGLHMRLGQVRPEWSAGAMRRLIRDLGPHIEQLRELALADMAAMGGDAEPTDIAQVMERIDETNAQMNAVAIRSPLTGGEVMETLQIGAGPLVGEAKQYLVNEIIEGRIPPDDRSSAVEALRSWAEDRRVRSAGD